MSVERTYDVNSRLSEVEIKIASQDRLNQYLMEQITNLESRAPAPPPGRQAGNQQNINVNEILNRMVVLEDQIRKDEKTKYEQTERIR
jgi:hypothetical protein